MDLRPAFERIPGSGPALLHAEALRLPPEAPARPAPLHFHPQVELVWFRRVSGTLRLDGTTLPLHDGLAVLLPSMQVHAFDTGTAARDWALLQFDPALLDGAAATRLGLPAHRPALLRPDPDTAARIDYLCDWLCAVAPCPDRAAEARHVLHLILHLLAATPPGGRVTLAEAAPLSGPLQDLLRRIHADPRRAPSLAEAARAAHVSDGHLSRLFKARIGMGYAAYLQMHRLNLAARALTEGDTPVAQIAYGVGFASAAHFSKAFSDRFGLGPRQFRRRAGGASPVPPAPQENESD